MREEILDREDGPRLFARAQSSAKYWAPPESGGESLQLCSVGWTGELRRSD